VKAAQEINVDGNDLNLLEYQIEVVFRCPTESTCLIDYSESECSGGFTNSCSAETSEKENSSNVGLIAGIVVGAAVLLIGAAAAIFFVSQKRKKRTKEFLQEARPSTELRQSLLSNIEILETIGAGHYGEVKKGQIYNSNSLFFVLEEISNSKEQENGRTPSMSL